MDSPSFTPTATPRQTMKSMGRRSSGDMRSLEVLFECMQGGTRPSPFFSLFLPFFLFFGLSQFMDSATKESWMDGLTRAVGEREMCDDAQRISLSLSSTHHHAAKAGSNPKEEISFQQACQPIQPYFLRPSTPPLFFISPLVAHPPPSRLFFLFFSLCSLLRFLRKDRQNLPLRLHPEGLLSNRKKQKLKAKNMSKLSRYPLSSFFPNLPTPLLTPYPST